MLEGRPSIEMTDSNIFRATEKDKPFHGDISDSPYIQRIIKLVCCRDTSTKLYRDSLSGLLKDPTSIQDIQLSILYLEAANGNATEAAKEKELDSLVRLGHALGKDRKPVDNHAMNPNADCSLAKTGNDYNAELCVIRLNVSGKAKTFTYPHASTIRPEVAADINALNRWRHIILRTNIGLSKTKDTLNVDFHPSQVDFLLNRYAESSAVESGLVNFERIKNDHNHVFTGQYLPGRFETCREKSTAAVAYLIVRRTIESHGTISKWLLHLGPLNQHEVAKKKFREEWKERCKANGMLVAEENLTDRQTLGGATLSNDS